METKMCIEDFVRQVLTPAISKLSPEEKAEVRAGWLAAYDRTALRLTGAGWQEHTGQVRFHMALPN